MTSAEHSYGPTCSLHVESNPFIRRASTISDLPPKHKAQFFYASALPIDDPLSPVPPPSTGSSSAPPKLPPRPFSAHDNAALEEAWQGLQRFAGRDKDSLKDEGTRAEALNETDVKSGSLTNIFKGLSKEREKEKSRNSLNASAGAGEVKDKEKSKLSTVETVSPPSPGSTADEGSTQEEPHLMLYGDPEHPVSATPGLVTSEEIKIAESESNLASVRSKRYRSPFRRRVKAAVAEDQIDTTSGKEQTPSERKSTDTQYGSSPSERNTTGTPFLRAPSRRRGSASSARDSETSQVDGAGEDERTPRSLTRPMFSRFRSDLSDSQDSEGGSRPRSKSPIHSFLSRHKEKEPRKAYVPVGISRLHLVEMPELQV